MSKINPKMGQLINDLKFKQHVLEKIHSRNESSRIFNLNIFYAILFGLLGNFTIALIYDLLLNNTQLHVGLKIILSLISLILLSGVILLINMENKKITEANEDINTALEEVIDNIDKLENEGGLVI